MVDGGSPGRRGSEVLDAIWDQVEAKPERTGTASLLFRSRALDQLDVAAEVDNQLPLVSRRTWLLLAGVGLVVAAFLLWAALTPSITSLTAPGRAVASTGVAPVAATSNGLLLSMSVDPGTQVRPGDTVAVLGGDQGEVAVRAVTDGVVWQQRIPVGAAVSAGEVVATLLPADSDRTLLLAVPESQAAAVVPGLSVTVSSATMVSGQVTATEAPLPAEEAAALTGLSLQPGTSYVLVTVGLDQPLPPGTSASAVIVLSDATVLQQLLGGS